MSEEYSVGYSEGYQAGWNAAMDATPPAAQRQWVGLTDEEIQVVLDDPQKYYDTMNDFARAIEARLKELNA
jgi:hypothetical protein